jgi:general secretion pathway protein J
VAPPPAKTVLPSGVRLVLTFADGGGFTGTLTRDVALGPQLP